MRKLFLIFITIVALGQSIFSADLPVKNQDVSPEQLKSQNKEITKLVATELSKNLPQVINKYTTVVSIKAVEANLIYTYEINTGAKSDDAIRAEDRTEWKKIYTENVCQRSKRFIDAQVKLSYVYTSKISKEKLFQFDIEQADCFKINRNY